MPDPRFFSSKGPLTLAALAELAGARLERGAPDTLIESVAPLDKAGPGDLSFLDNRKYADAFSRSEAGACCVHPEMVARAPASMALLISETPYRSFALAAQAFFPQAASTGERHVSAIIDPSAAIGDEVEIGPGAVIGANVTIGGSSKIEANAVIGPGVIIGAGCWIGAGAVLSHCHLGRRVRIFPGGRIGQDGFGYALEKSGPVKVPQLGRVIIGDGTEIGANTTVDRGTGPDTVIGEGCIIDNLVQIGHNVVLGRGCVIAAQTGISGSTKVGDYAMMGGQAGLTGHLTIGTGAQIAGKAGVMRDIPDGGAVGGSPAVPLKDWHRQTVALARIARSKTRAEK